MGYKILGIGEPHYIRAGGKGSKGDMKRLAVRNGLRLYDLRHNSACYWVQRYKKESVLKYRFGWKNSNMIFYYTEFLGLRDDISDNDILIDQSKTELQQKLDQSNKDIEMLKTEMSTMKEMIINDLKKEILAKMEAKDAV